MKNIIVIGAGVVGISTALNAQTNGHRVTLIDPRGMGTAASSGNAGVIAVSEVVPVATPGVLRQVPAMLLSENSPLKIRYSYLPKIAPWLWRFAQASTPRAVDKAVRSLTPFLAQAKAAHQRLASAAGLSLHIKEVGWLKVFESDASFRKFEENLSRMRSAGVPSEYLNGAEVARCEPGLRLPMKHGILHTSCSQIEDPAAYVQGLGECFLSRGGHLLKTEVHGLVRDASGVRAAKTDQGNIEADAFVIAAGAWSKRLARDAGAVVPLDTERGYHIILKDRQFSRRALSRPVYWAEQSLVMSPSEGKIRVTSSVEFAGIDAPADYRAILRQVPNIRRALHGMETGEVVEKWLGFRPSMPDSLPVIGVAPKSPNCFFAFGHGHIGLTCGPVTGEIIGDLIDGRTPSIDVSAFAADRF